MTISRDKVYKTANGYKVSVLTTTAAGHDGKPWVVALAHIPPDEVCEHATDRILTTDSEGICMSGEEWNLVEVKPWDDFKIDEPVMVRGYEEGPWLRAHYAGTQKVDGETLPCTWAQGKTGWTMTDWALPSKAELPKTVPWAQCRRPTPKELQP